MSLIFLRLVKKIHNYGSPNYWRMKQISREFGKSLKWLLTGEE